MFTGIVEEIGTLRRMKPTASSCTLTISCEKVLEGTKLGDSIAVNGTCLTVTRMDTHSFDCDVTPETLSRTSFSMVRVGSPLNLERALRLSDRLGGHIVLGHVDTTGRLISFIKEGNAVNITISVEQKWMKYIVEKGSVAIDGVSLTVAKRGERPLHDLPHPTYGGEDHPSRETPGRPGECRVRLPGKICGAAHEKGHGRRSHHGYA